MCSLSRLRWAAGKFGTDVLVNRRGMGFYVRKVESVDDNLKSSLFSEAPEKDPSDRDAVAGEIAGGTSSWPSSPSSRSRGSKRGKGPPRPRRKLNQGLGPESKWSAADESLFPSSAEGGELLAITGRESDEAKAERRKGLESIILSRAQSVEAEVEGKPELEGKRGSIFETVPRGRGFLTRLFSRGKKSAGDLEEQDEAAEEKQLEELNKPPENVPIPRWRANSKRGADPYEDMDRNAPLKPYPTRRKLGARAVTLMQRINRFEGLGMVNTNRSVLVKKIPHVQPGDVVRLKLKNLEDDGSHYFTGAMIALRRRGLGGSFVLRNTVGDIALEWGFHLYSPSILDAEILGHRKVRRRKLYYLRHRALKYSNVGPAFSKPEKVVQLERERQKARQQQAKKTRR